MNYSGFKNEEDIRKALHNKQFVELNANLQCLIEDSFKKYDDVILCTKQAGKNKSDLCISIGNESHTYSIKKGAGNSVHQEPVEQFIEFLQKNYSISDKIKNDIRFFIWGDGTLDGSGLKKSRLKVKDLKIKYPQIIQGLNTFFESIKDDLITRFVFRGADCSKFDVDFIYFGTNKKGICCSSDTAFNIIANNKSNRTLISVGILSFQSWNRAIKKDSTSDHKRGQIQLKLGTLEKLVRGGNKGTKEGNIAEMELVKALNSNKKSTLWGNINLEKNKNYYAVRCTKKVLSKISNKKVLPKSDVYIIESLENITMEDYYLDEKILLEQKTKYTYVLNSGISVKEKASKSFTYQKMTIETFNKIFGNYELGCGIEYFTTPKDFDKNLAMEIAWNTNQEAIINKINQLKQDYNYTDDLPVDTYQNIKRSSIKLTRYIIDTDFAVSDFIFRGVGAFENPYFANFLYKNSQMTLNIAPSKYTITTGSNRSGGKYTIVIKP